MSTDIASISSLIAEARQALTVLVAHNRTLETENAALRAWKAEHISVEEELGDYAEWRRQKDAALRGAT